MTPQQRDLLYEIAAYVLADMDDRGMCNYADHIKRLLKLSEEADAELIARG